ncbi:MAG: hypothetical protein ACRDYY_03005 [Acidimicrobiales bacterium]
MAAGALPGTFDPPTVAHLAIAEAAWRQGQLDRVDLVVSEDPLGKRPTVPSLADRVAVLEEVASSRPWLGVRVTALKLISDLAASYDAVVLGADKWVQVVDPSWYGGSITARDAAVAALPRLLLASRPPHRVPAGLPPGALLLDVDAAHAGVSSSEVRAGRWAWMAPEAAGFDEATGAWSDPARYLRERAG